MKSLLYAFYIYKVQWAQPMSDGAVKAAQEREQTSYTQVSLFKRSHKFKFQFHSILIYETDLIALFGVPY